MILSICHNNSSRLFSRTAICFSPVNGTRDESHLVIGL